MFKKLIKYLFGQREEYNLPEVIDKSKFFSMQQIINKLISSKKDYTVELVDFIIKQGIYHRASDIHIEPYEDQYRVKFRIDGYFLDVAKINSNVMIPFFARLKVMAELASFRTDVVQEGRITFTMGGNRSLELRISIMPTIIGEKAVMRVFSFNKELLHLSKLGYTNDVFDKLKKLIQKPQGIMFFTGPASSGKTTAIYAILNELVNTRPDFSIVSIEDPVEYNLGVINQIEVNEKKGLTFEKALQSILRQDPKVIVLGEIRSEETARMGIQSGLTGHLVITTLHAQNVAGVFTRLMDLNIEPYLLSSSIIGVVSQRLVRKICEKCKEEIDSPMDIHLKENNLVEKITRYYRGKGCENCLGTGYFGRIPIAEILVMDNIMSDFILSKPTMGAIFKKAQELGMQSIASDGVEQIKRGITTFDELTRVVDI